MNRNKFFAVLILIWMAWAWFLFYQFKYIPYKNAKIEAEEIKKQQAIEEASQPKFVKQELEKVELTKTQKIDEIKDKKNYYKVINLSNYSKAYFKKQDDILTLYFADKNIWSFTLVSTNKLRVDLIEGTEGDLYIKVWNDRFYYRNKINETVRIDLNIDVKYVKTGSTNNILFVTEKWTFIYNIFSQNLEFFTYFNDFVNYNDWYIWIVNNDEKRILNNLWYQDEKENLIIYYNPQSKEKKIVMKTNENIEKIFIFNNEIFIKTKNKDLFKIDNIYYL